MNYVSEIMYILFTHGQILTGKDCDEIPCINSVGGGIIGVFNFTYIVSQELYINLII